MENLSDEQILKIVSKKGYNLKFASPKQKDNYDIVLAAVKQYGWAIQHASPTLIENRNIVLEAVKQDYIALEYGDIKFRDDKEIILHTVSKNGFSLKLASERLKKDREVITAAIIQNSSAIKYASEIYKKDIILFNLTEPLLIHHENGNISIIYDWLEADDLIDHFRKVREFNVISDLRVNDKLCSITNIYEIKADLLEMDNGPEAHLICKM